MVANFNQNLHKEQAVSSLPYLWVTEEIQGIDRLTQHFQLVTPDASPAPGYHIIALNGERSVRQVLRKLQTIPRADIRIYPGELLLFESPDGLLMKSQPAERWLEIVNKEPLQLEEAVAIAEDLLKTESDRVKLNLDLDQLRQRVSASQGREMSSWEWDKKYVEPLKAKLEKDFQLPAFGGGSGSGGDGGDGKQPLAELSLRDRILEILNRNQDRAQRDETLINLSKQVTVSYRDIKELAALLEAEIDLGESRADRKDQIKNLLRIGKYDLILSDYLDSDVATPLEKVAGWMGTKPAAMLTTLYPVISSLLKVGTRLELLKATDFYALPITYSGIVAESGSAKSPAQKTILNPLYALQAEEDAQYKLKLQEYEIELSEWQKSKDPDKGPAPDKPFLREYYTNDATREAIALILSQQPERGLLGSPDELAALFKSQGEYKGGRGADKENLLSGKDGSPLKVNRAGGKRINVPSTYSITGTIQPDVLRKMMGDFTDPSGEWARFFWSVLRVQPAPYPDDAICYDVSGLLKGIYKRLEALPATTYKLSEEARFIYRAWFNELDALKLAESRQGLRAVYSKMKGDTGVLALLLHCFNSCVRVGDKPADFVSAKTMKAAIKLARYHIGQVKLVHAEGDAANGDVAAIHTKIIELSERKGWLKAADVRDIDRQVKKKFTANEIRAHFQELEKSGFGKTKGEGIRLMWSICTSSPNPDNPPPNSPENKTQGNFEELRTNSVQTSKNTGSASIISVQSLGEKNSGQTQVNSGQTRDSVKMAESIGNTKVEELKNKTQDSQDSFFTNPAPSPTLVAAGNEIKGTDLNFDALSYPEFGEKAQNQGTVGISEDLKTQDSCPENVLNCPDFKESDLSCPEFDEAIALIPEPTTETAQLDQTTQLEQSVQIADVAEESLNDMSLDNLQAIAADLADEELCPNKEVLADLRKCWSPNALDAACEFLSPERQAEIKNWVVELNQPTRTPRFDDRIRLNNYLGTADNFMGTLVGSTPDGDWYIEWDKIPASYKKLRERMGKPLPELPLRLKADEFELI